MSKYKIIIFDLDGTIADSKPGITKSVQYALAKLNIVENDLDKLEIFVGPPLKESFMKYYNMDEDTSIKAYMYYREYYTDKGIFENELYKGVLDMLKLLKRNNKRLYIATSKPKLFADKVINQFNLEPYFELVEGNNINGTIDSKAEIIKSVIASINNVRLRDIIVVGDRKYDILGAKENGVDSIGVKYGYAVDKELEITKPTFLVEDIKELTEHLL